MTSQAYSGAVQGAVAGGKVGGPWGAVIGAVVGIAGGLLGDKAAKYRRQARAEEQRAVELQQAVQRRNIVREVYLARGEAIAAAAGQETGAMESSAPKGAIASIGSRGFSNVKFFDALVARQIVQQYYLKKADKKQGQSDLIMGLISSVGGGGMGGMGGGGGSAPSQPQTDNSVQSWVSDFKY